MAEWNDVFAMLDDIVKFAQKHPKHQFLWNDRLAARASLGIVAYIDKAEDEQVQEWTLPLSAVRAANSTDSRWPILIQALKTADGKRQLLEALVAHAKSLPPDRRTRWELFNDQLDED